MARPQNLGGQYKQEDASRTTSSFFDLTASIQFPTMYGLILTLFAVVGQAQQSYIPGHGPSLSPRYCSTREALALPSASPTMVFSYTMTETTRLAVPVASDSPTTYAPPFSKVSYLIGNLSTTSWGDWYSNKITPTDTADSYGQAAWSSMWEMHSPKNFTRGIYTTTVSPTPLPTNELLAPPPRYFSSSGNCYTFPENFVLGVAGAAAQIEGAVADQGRSPALPDILPNFAANIPSLSSGYELAYDYTAIENYYLYKQDIERLASAGVKSYSFSIPWTRILPFVLPGTPINSHGVAHALYEVRIVKDVQYRRRQRPLVNPCVLINVRDWRPIITYHY